jgi:hypothetical protein
MPLINALISGKSMTENKRKRNRLGNLMSPMGVASAHGKLLRRMQKALDEVEAQTGKFDLVAACRVSQGYSSQRTLLETTEVEREIDEIKKAIDALRAGDNRNVVQFKRA